MPRAALGPALAALLARIVESRIASIRPKPKVGVGMRKLRLPWAAAVAKSGCVMLQPGASDRPEITKRSCTPPSRTVFAGGSAYLNRTSRTGPLFVRNDGIELVAPSLVATAICGLTDGADPPMVGWAWQP